VGALEIERDGETLIVTPVTDLRELDYEQIEQEAAEVLNLLASGAIRNVILDFRRTDYYGSTALGFVLKLWKRVRSRNGRMAFCNVSDHEREILQVTALDGLWPVCSTREEARKAIREAAGKDDL
jgi:anti-anti-sigma factor